MHFKRTVTFKCIIDNYSKGKMATLEVIEGLKVKASTAQSLFTKRANKIENNLNSLREDKLVAELEELEDHKLSLGLS